MVSKGKLYVLDGLDGSGKTTQLRLLDESLKQKGKDYRLISFPDYAQPSSAPVKQYLEGAFGGAREVNAYAASSFYAVDRWANFQRCWRRDYENGIPIVAARYTTSNAIHQMSKLPEPEWDGYLHWLADYEYGRLRLPRPGAVLFLDMPLDLAQRLLTARYGGKEEKKDIHESDPGYLAVCRRAALYTAAQEGWYVISCAEGDAPRAAAAIAADIERILRL
ncbi:MAG: thymidylate kinase [Oscillospiraceae bacterium]|nr:thymidylate kinase [Oscillospiraceae bacterium]